MGGSIRVKVGGEFACFTRPEFKVERVSYPVMTPSAARGILEAIFWKPEFRYRIREIWVLKPIREFVILRNELSERQAPRGDPVFIEEKRQQRASLVLKNVEYIINAEIELMPHASDPLPKYLSQIERRIQRGQFHHAPYLGTREFSAWFEPPSEEDRPQDIDMEIGTMLFDMAFIESTKRRELQFLKHSSKGASKVEGFSSPLFFNAKVEKGILKVPSQLYQELNRLENSHA